MHVDNIKKSLYPISLGTHWYDGHSGGDTPGLIPNPEVKPTYVLCGTVVREPTGSLAPSGVVDLWPRYGSWFPAASANGYR